MDDRAWWAINSVLTLRVPLWHVGTHAHTHPVAHVFCPCYWSNIGPQQDDIWSPGHAVHILPFHLERQIYKCIQYKHCYVCSVALRIPCSLPPYFLSMTHQRAWLFGVTENWIGPAEVQRLQHSAAFGPDSQFILEPADAHACPACTSSDW